MLSIKARYISQMNFREKHFIEAIECLNKIIVFYCIVFPATSIVKIELDCFDATLTKDIDYFKINLSSTI